MTEVPFHATRMGRTFFEHTMPELVRQLARLNENLERARDVRANEERPGINRSDESADHPG